jgi:hypothetical protein
LHGAIVFVMEKLPRVAVIIVQANRSGSKRANIRIHLRGLPDALREDCSEQDAGDCLPEMRGEEERDSAFRLQLGEWI